MKDSVTKIEISQRTIIFTVLFLLSLRLLWEVREILFSIFIAFIIMSVAKPLVGRLEKYKIPRALSALVIFIILTALVSYGVYWILPLLVSDMTDLLRSLSVLVGSVNHNISGYIDPRSLTQFVPNISGQIFPFLRNIFSNVVFLVTTVFLSFYFIVEENFVRAFTKKLFKEPQASYVARIFDKTEQRLGSWFSGQVVLMVVIGLMTYAGLSLIGVHHALSLAVIAGLLEAFPIIGPLIAAVPAFIFAVNQSPLLGLTTIALYLIIQQLENNVLVPIVMRRTVGLNKIVTLIVVIIGGKLAGILGIFIAIPLTLCVESILTESVNTKENEGKKS